MFTGLIESVGTVRALTSSATPRLTVATPLARRLKVGDSIAVSGVCLTAVEIGKDFFAADLAAETIGRTSLGQLRPGSIVNVELPARADSRLDGHVVQGHVDGTATLVRLERVTEADDLRLELDLSEGLAQDVVPQGSITIEGISLTVAALDGVRVRIAIIPHTYSATNLQSLRPGALLNIETDVLAKYARKQSARERRFTVDELTALGF